MEKAEKVQNLNGSNVRTKVILVATLITKTTLTFISANKTLIIVA